MSRERRPQRYCGCCGGEYLETVSRSLGVTAATLTAWRDAFLAAVRGRADEPAYRVEHVPAWVAHRKACTFDAFPV
jgi:hypothetical protein